MTEAEKNNPLQPLQQGVAILDRGLAMADRISRELPLYDRSTQVLLVGVLGLVLSIGALFLTPLYSAQPSIAFPLGLLAFTFLTSFMVLAYDFFMERLAAGAMDANRDGHDTSYRAQKQAEEQRGSP